MTTPVTADTAALTRIRAEEALDRGNGASRSAGELAGRFAAMLEQLNGVAGAPDQTGAAAPVGRVSAEPKVSLGAVSLFAQGDAAAAAGPSPTSADGADAVVRHTLGGAPAMDVRWLTTLFTQSGSAG